MLRSLKLRLAVLTALITIVIMVSGGAFMLKNIQSSKIDKIDEEIKRLAVTTLPRLLDLRSPRDRPRDRARENSRTRPPEDLSELPEDFWLTVSKNNGTTFFNSPNTPPTWLETYPLSEEAQNSPFLDGPQRFPIGRLLGSFNPEFGRPRVRESLPDQLISRIEFSTLEINERSYRIGFINTETDYQINFIKDLSITRLELREIRRSVFRTIPLFILLTISASVFLASRALSPFKRLSGNIDQVSGAGLNARLETTKIPSEFIPLIESINEMLERIDRSFHQANRFAADASHELRTPLTILQGHLEKLIQAEPDSTPLRQEEYANLLGEVNRLQRLSTQLLFLARSDSGHFKIERKSVNLNPELEELIEDYEDLYPDFRFKLKIPDSKKVSVDWPLLRQAVVNLLSNAVIYSNDIQSITLDYFYENDHFTISVKNHGEPIADDIAQRLFDRFYRAEESRTRKAGASGTGLGLSLANECVKAHGGSISYKGNSQGINRFDIEIPLAK